MTEDIKWTAKQVEILQIIKAKNPDDTYVSVYDIMDRLSYKVKRDALLHSIKVLIDYDYVIRMPSETRNKKAVRPFYITSKAYPFI